MNVLLFSHLWGGTKVLRTRLGFLTDFCPVCRDARPFQVDRLELGPHLMDQPTGPLTPDGEAVRCAACAADFAAPAGAASACVPDLAQAASALMPDVSARLDLERRRQRNHTTDAERSTLLREPFDRLEPMAFWAIRDIGANRAVTISVHTRTLACLCVGLTLAAFGGTFLTIRHRSWDAGPSPASIGIPILAAGIPFLLAATWFFFTAGHRHVRQVLQPLLARSLKPLAPTREDLEPILSALKGSGRIIGRCIRVRSLVKALTDGSATRG